MKQILMMLAVSGSFAIPVLVSGCGDGARNDASRKTVAEDWGRGSNAPRSEHGSVIDDRSTVDGSDASTGGDVDVGGTSAGGEAAK